MTRGKLRQHGEKLGSEIGECGNNRGANRGARRGRERDFHNIQSVESLLYLTNSNDDGFLVSNRHATRDPSLVSLSGHVLRAMSLQQISPACLGSLKDVTSDLPVVSPFKL